MHRLICSGNRTRGCDNSDVRRPAPLLQPSLFDLAPPTISAPPTTSSTPTASSTPTVRVVRSRKRRRTVTARMVDGVLEVLIPAWMSKKEEAATVDEMRAKVMSGGERQALQLPERTAGLARRFDLPVPASVKWADNMAHRWGSCTTTDGSIRISSRLERVPTWVLDAVIVHELAHLVHADHSASFWALVERYPKLARAQGFLEGLSFVEDGVSAVD